MSPPDLLALGGTVGGLMGAAVLVFSAFRTNTSAIWREEALAQKSRADRLESDLTEIKLRLTAIERENQRLVELLTALDPGRISPLRPPTD